MWVHSKNAAIVSNTFEEDFTYDVTGNWLNYNRNGTIQTRTHNTTNEIQTISGGNTLVSHDRNGCMTKFPKPWNGTDAYTCIYDAWNRMTSIRGSSVVTYMYDARNHRIKKTVGTVVTLSYFNQNWQEIESVAAGMTTTHVYGLRYIDDVIMRVKTDETLYALQDPNWNVVALVTPSGTVAERLTYDSFGKPTFRNADFTVKTTSSYGWTKTFTGQVYDSETGLLLYRNRYYHPGLGRFITRDPIGYRGEDSNLYRYTKNVSTTDTDSAGMKKDCVICNCDCDECNRTCLPEIPDGVIVPEYWNKPVYPTLNVFSQGAYGGPCGDYDLSMGSKCIDCKGNTVIDPYPSKAKEVCNKFVRLYNSSRSVECVAKCLSAEEYGMSQVDSCDQRNEQRIKNHVSCYASCGFIPYKGMPEGASEVGWNMLLPSVCRNYIGGMSKLPSYPGRCVGGLGTTSF